MRTLWFLIMLAIAESLAFAQLDSDTLAVSVSQSHIFQPDTVLFTVDVSTGVNASLDEVVARFKNAGITSAIFYGLSSVEDPPALDWLFTVSVPISELQATIARLAGLNVTFYLQGSRVSQQLLDAQQCSLPNLMALARAQAKKMADAVELAVGDVLALSDENSLITSYNFVSVPTLAVRNGFNQVSGGFLTQAVTGSNCSLTVKFKLLRYHY